MENEQAQVSDIRQYPRGESHLTYMIPITLIKEFALDGGAR